MERRSLKTMLAEKDALAALIRSALDAAKPHEDAVAALDTEIAARVADPIRQARTLAGKDTGTVTVVVDGVAVKESIPKTVAWDQDKLAEIRARIAGHGDDPDEYISTKTVTTHRVDEKAFAAFPDPIKAVFAPAREVKAGKATTTFTVS